MEKEENKPEQEKMMGRGMPRIEVDEEEMPIPGATSFAELDAVKAAQIAAEAIKARAGQFTGLVDNIITSPDIENKGQAIAQLGNEFGDVAGEAMQGKDRDRWQPITDAVNKALSPLLERFRPEVVPTEEGPPPDETKAQAKNSFMVYKEADGYRWLAIYSNKFRDRDTPPEIISEASHLNFVKQVNSGELPFPELWLWHVDGSRWGEADFVGYDDNGFAVATGTVDKGREWVAESLMAFDGDLLTSHGMPTGQVERDPDDPTIITRHVTKEISPLPSNVAANEFTGFNISDEVIKQMALTEQDKAKLDALGVDSERLEGETDSKAKETEGLEFKEAEPDATPGKFVSRDEVAELVKSVAISTNQLVEVVGRLAGRIERIEATQEAVEKDTLERTPAASLTDLYQSVIGAEETKIDGRSTLAKSGPEETAAPSYSGGLAEAIALRNQEIERGGVQ